MITPGSYSQPYDARYPVICRDEQPKLLRADKRPPQPARPGRPATYDYAYVRHGTCTLWPFVEPLGQWRPVHATARRTDMDWARPVQAVADHPRDRQAERLIRVCDHLNASFYRAFPPAEARWPGATPRHIRWLHRAEPELSVLTRQALSPRRSPRGRRPATRPQRVSTGRFSPRTPADDSNICAL